MQRIFVHWGFVPGAVGHFPGITRRADRRRCARILPGRVSATGRWSISTLPTGPCSRITPAFGAVSLGRGFERVDQLHQRAVQAVDGIAVPGGEFGEELEAHDLFFVLVDVLGPVARIMSYSRW